MMLMLVVVMRCLAVAVAMVVMVARLAPNRIRGGSALTSCTMSKQSRRKKPHHCDQSIWGRLCGCTCDGNVVGADAAEYADGAGHGVRRRTIMRAMLLMLMTTMLITLPMTMTMALLILKMHSHSNQPNR